MNTWLITDTHFGHDKMVEYCGRPDNFAMRILEGLAIVKSGDMLVHLGDFCIGRDSYWHDIFFSTIRQIGNVSTVLTLGNHDKRSQSWYMRHGWSLACQDFSILYNQKKITFSHIPIRGISNINVHGHYHNNLDRLLNEVYVVEGEKERNEQDFPMSFYDKSKYKLLSMEKTKYKPVNLNYFSFK